MENEKKPFQVKGTIIAIWIIAAIVILANIIGMLGSCSDDSGSSGFKANTWYRYSELESLQYKNCVIYNAMFTGGGKRITVTYYPICSSCGHIEDFFDITTFDAGEPAIKGHYCSECIKQTAVSFKFNN